MAMKRSLAIVALLFAIPAFASDLTVHLDLSDSVRAALAHGQIKSVLVGVGTGRQGIDTTNDTVVVHDVAPGKTNVRAFLRAGELYVVDPKGVDVDVPPAGNVDVTVPIHSLFVTGSVTQHGQPFHGHQMNIFPSVPPAPPSRDNFGFAVPFDKDGHFAFPLPHAGEWDLTVWIDRGQLAAKIKNFAFHNDDTQHEVHIELP